MRGTLLLVAYVATVFAVVAYGVEDNLILSPMEENQVALLCCKSLKTMGTVDICLDPCCYGYHEKVSETPQLGVVSWCERKQLSSKRRRYTTRSRGNKDLRQYFERALLSTN